MGRSRAFFGAEAAGKLTGTFVVRVDREQSLRIGQSLTIALNGTELPALQLDQAIQGQVGLIVSGGATARFDNFKLEELSGSSTGAAHGENVHNT